VAVCVDSTLHLRCSSAAPKGKGDTSIETPRRPSAPRAKPFEWKSFRR
jgi:hypothetical protein